jgi:hypothetical protein
MFLRMGTLACSGRVFHAEAVAADAEKIQKRQCGENRHKSCVQENCNRLSAPAGAVKLFDCDPLGPDAYLLTPGTNPVAEHEG